MAKPDLQAVYVKADDGTLRRLDGKLGLAHALENLPEYAGDTQALAGGLASGDLYRKATGEVMVVLP
jgi:hypothetical protein